MTKKLKGYGTFDVVLIVILVIVSFACVYPFWYVFANSFASYNVASRGAVAWWPSELSLDGYRAVFENKYLVSGFTVTVLRTIVATSAHVLFTSFVSYAMSRPNLIGKKIYMKIAMITMFFNGGLIPTYLLINNIGLLDSMWAVILPGAFSVWNMIIARTYYQGIPRELREAADVDGASEMRYFFNILLPVCMPVVAVLALWQFVAMWNSYFDAMIYLNSASKQPLQLVLRSILIQSQPESGMIADIQSTAERAKMAELLKYATIIISSLPLLVMYPFFQKYFDAGIMAGSVKG